MKSPDITVNIQQSQLAALCSRLAAEGMPAESVRCIYRGRNLLAACRVGDLSVCIKDFRVPGLLKGLIYGTVRMSKARRSYVNAQRLLSLGVPTPRPLAYVLTRRLAVLLDRSYYLCEQLPDSWQQIRYMEQRPDYPELVVALGRWVAEVHGKGVLIKDLSPGNILFRSDGSSYSFCLVDVNRMQFDVADRRRQLYRAGWLMNSEESSADFARSYAAAAGIDAAEAVAVVVGSYRALQRRAAMKRKLRSR